MERFESGVGYFSTFLLPVHFPEDVQCCWYCPAYDKRWEECKATGATVIRAKTFIDPRCPIIFGESEDDNGNTGTGNR